jgi:hypothetical protein
MDVLVAVGELIAYLAGASFDIARPPFPGVRDGSEDLVG